MMSLGSSCEGGFLMAEEPNATGRIPRFFFKRRIRRSAEILAFCFSAATDRRWLESPDAISVESSETLAASLDKDALLLLLF